MQEIRNVGKQKCRKVKMQESKNVGKQKLRKVEMYEKSQDLTSSILPAKSESLHQCEMKKRREGRDGITLHFFSSMQMLGTRPDLYKKIPQ